MYANVLGTILCGTSGYFTYPNWPGQAGVQASDVASRVSSGVILGIIKEFTRYTQEGPIHQPRRGTVNVVLSDRADAEEGHRQGVCPVSVMR